MEAYLCFAYDLYWLQLIDCLSRWNGGSVTARRSREHVMKWPLALFLLAQGSR